MNSIDPSPVVVWRVTSFESFKDTFPVGSGGRLTGCLTVIRPIAFHSRQLKLSAERFRVRESVSWLSFADF
jgi:hypothetical protein